VRRRGTGAVFSLTIAGRASRVERGVSSLATVHWLAVSIVLSILLTVVLNVATRAFPRASEHIGQKLADLDEKKPESGVYVPWKAMIVVSVVLTIGLNLLFWTFR
jgi:hypothetical protein